MGFTSQQQALWVGVEQRVMSRCGEAMGLFLSTARTQSMRHVGCSESWNRVLRGRGGFRLILVGVALLNGANKEDGQLRISRTYALRGRR